MRLPALITETDNLLFSAMTHNPQPLHIDAEFARKSQHGQILVNSLYTLGLVIGISVGETTLGTTIGNLGMENVEFPHPVFIRRYDKSYNRDKEQAGVGKQAGQGSGLVRA